MSVLFPQELIKVRKEANLTQAEAAKGIGISRGALANYEAGLREPNLDTIIKIATFYNVNVDRLIGRYKGMFGTTYDHERLVLKTTDAIYYSMLNEEEQKEHDELKCYHYFEKGSPRYKLFQTLDGSSDAEVEQAIRIIEALRK